MKKLLVNLISILQLLSFSVVPCFAVPPPPGGTPSNARTIFVYEVPLESDTNNNNENEDSSHKEKPLSWVEKIKLKSDLGDPEATQKLAEIRAKHRASSKKYRKDFKDRVLSNDPKAIQKLAEIRAKQRASYKRRKEKLKDEILSNDPNAIQKLAEIRAKQRASFKKWKDKLKAQVNEGLPEAIQKLNKIRDRGKAYRASQRKCKADNEPLKKRVPDNTVSFNAAIPDFQNSDLEVLSLADFLYQTLKTLPEPEPQFADLETSSSSELVIPDLETLSQSDLQFLDTQTPSSEDENSQTSSTDSQLNTEQIN